jgi:hypothetical protein
MLAHGKRNKKVLFPKNKLFFFLALGISVNTPIFTLAQEAY